MSSRGEDLKGIGLYAFSLRKKCIVLQLDEAVRTSWAVSEWGGGMSGPTPKSNVIVEIPFNELEKYKLYKYSYNIKQLSTL